MRTRQGQSILHLPRADRGDIQCGAHPRRWQCCSEGGQSLGSHGGTGRGQPGQPHAGLCRRRTKLRRTKSSCKAPQAPSARAAGIPAQASLLGLIFLSALQTRRGGAFLTPNPLFLSNSTPRPMKSISEARPPQFNLLLTQMAPLGSHISG